MIGLAVCIAVILDAAGPLVLRGAEPTPEARVLRVDLDGVLVAWADRSPATEVIPLNLVRVVSQSEQGAWADVSATADSLWRAVARLDRGDVVGAEPLFEQLFTVYRTRRSPTSHVVSGGLLRCRLARYAHAAAIEPWIVWLASEDASQGVSDYAAFSTGASSTLNSRDIRLIAALPPIWTTGPATRAIAESTVVSALAEGAPPVVRHLRDLYVAAAAFETDGIEREIVAQTGGDPALALVREIVASRVGGLQARSIARESLHRRLTAEAPAWIHAWCRTAIGRSLLREPEIEDQRRAIIELISVHAFHSVDTPYLAGVALAEAARAAQGVGDAEASEALWRELAERYPGHPSIDPSTARSVGPGVSRAREPSEAAPSSAPEPPEGGG